jgi:D-alanyl-D-alanine dipeptidase
MHTKLYRDVKTTFLRKPAAIALARVQKELNIYGLGLKIWDAYRPYSITEKMWEPIKDDRYVADPKFGSRHNRGIAVDLTVIDLRSGKELDMGTGFDNFTDTAHSTFRSLPAEVLSNRLLLKTAMEQQRFTGLDSEWWHFSFEDIVAFELLDLSFPQLYKLSKSVNLQENKNQ